MTPTTTARRAGRAPRRWTALVGVGLRLRLARRARLLSDLDYWTRDTARIQAAQLRALITAAQRTQFGAAHGFARLAGLADAELLSAYRVAVPHADYAAFRAPIADMREHARPDVLWPGLVRDFAQTSGTTAGDKFIPVSAEMMRSNYRAALDIFAAAIRFGVSIPGITSGKTLFLGGSTKLEVNAHGIRTGDLSGLVTPLIRWPISRIYSPGPQVALMSHWPSKLDAMADLCIDQDVRMINGMPSWALALFEKVLQKAGKRPGTRGRAPNTLRDLWPNFTVFVHGGVKYAPFDARVRQFYSGGADDIPCRIELYPASEGFIAIQDRPGEPSLRLLTDIGNFYEFIPLERIDDPAAPAYTADQVERGQRYVVVMSTCAGLWRYVIGDVVEFDSIPAGLKGRSGDGPSRLRIVGRHRHFINAFGENIIVEHVENAVADAARLAALTVGEFTAAPVYAGPEARAGLQLALECAPLPPEARRLTEFALRFDESLKRQNVDYTTKRTDDLGMAPPIVTPLPMGAFHRWMESRGKLGGQHKCPRCANHRDIIDAVLSAQPRIARVPAVVTPPAPAAAVQP